MKTENKGLFLFLSLFILFISSPQLLSSPPSPTLTPFLFSIPHSFSPSLILSLPPPHPTL